MAINKATMFMRIILGMRGLTNDIWGRMDLYCQKLMGMEMI